MLESVHGISIGGEDTIAESSRETVQGVVDGVVAVGVQEVITVFVTIGGGGRDGGREERQQNEAQASHG